MLKEIINGEEVTITPVTHGKCREDKERKKIRDRFELLVNVSIQLPDFTRSVKFKPGENVRVRNWGGTVSPQDWYTVARI